MSSKVFSVAIVGLEASLVEVEVDISGGLALFNIVGLPGKAVAESKERVSAALKNSKAEMYPQKKAQRITVNLAPADIKKQGSLYDLPIAVGYLLASQQIYFDPDKKLFCGELSLNGKLRHVNGILAIVDFAKKHGFEEIYLPKIDAKEASLIRGLKIKSVENLKDIIEHFNNIHTIEDEPESYLFKEALAEEESEKGFLDFAHICGQEQAKRALELASAGGHNVLFSGPPGSGKTILARTFPTILPKMEIEEALEVTRIFSIAGILTPEKPLLVERPFRSPHHSASNISLIGGGSFPKPGEVTLSHRGVLFLDEFPEFSGKAIEVLRQPMEDGYVTISRAAGTVRFPANFILIAAMNPCPCGNLNDPLKNCTCMPSQIASYRRKISGPILDRIDIHVTVARMEYEKLTSKTTGEPSCQIRERVEKARKVQRKRFGKLGTLLNSDMANLQVKQFCDLDDYSKSLMKNAVNQYHLSVRSYFRILKVARTVADLRNGQDISQEDLAEAIQYRIKEDS